MIKIVHFILGNAAFGLLFFVLPQPTQAENCSSTGSLEYLGIDTSQTQSMWLSTTSSGSFQLEAAQQTVDHWTRGDDGTHLSYSSNVSSGNGGTHKLYGVTDNTHCLLDSANQKGGSILPDVVLPPVGRPVLPVAILPPEAITPGRPVKPSKPIGTLPPTGITPNRPVNPGFPIGTIPIKPKPPIGTLPPTGITPERPIKPEPPIGTLPIEAKPPIGTLPPTGITPERPVKPEPPIGTLPIEAKPPISTLPPTGITPERPVKPEPPIGTLPIEAKPPIGTLPPTGITPERPVKPEPPIGTLPNEGGLGNHSSQQGDLKYTDIKTRKLTCPKDIGKQIDQTILNDPRYAHCFGTSMEPDQGSDDGDAVSAPVTPGRHYDKSSQWNTWVNPKNSKIKDRRYGRDFDAENMSLSLGADKRFGKGWIAGLWMDLLDTEFSNFHSLVESDSDGFTVGPYIGKIISNNWAISAFFSYGRFDNATKLLIFEGDYKSEVYSVLLDVNGFYALSDETKTSLQPRFSVNYAHTKSEAFNLQGTLFGRPICFEVEETELDYGTLVASMEINRIFYPGKATTELLSTIEPFFELGVSFEFERPDNGKILTRDLTYKTPSAWSGLAKTGVRSKIGDSIYVEARLAYTSIGQSDYDEWESSLYISYSF